MENEKKAGKSFGRRLVSFLKSLLRGELVVRLKLDKYMAHIVVVAMAFVVIMLLHCLVENCLIRREKVKEELEEAEMICAQKNLELVGLGRMSTVEKLLEQNGVGVGKPEKPAIIIEK